MEVTAKHRKKTYNQTNTNPKPYPPRNFSTLPNHMPTSGSLLGVESTTQSHTESPHKTRVKILKKDDPLVEKHVSIVLLHSPNC